jgi:hypothetical protein
MAELDQRLADMLDRQEIADLLTRYGIAIDSRQWDLLDTVFTPDATIDYSTSGAPKGRYPEIKVWLETFLTKFPMNQHMTLNSHITLDGDSATGRTYFFNPNSFPDETGVPRMIFVGGFYNDRFVRTDAGWRIAEREGETAWMYSDDPPEVWARRTGL